MNIRVIGLFVALFALQGCTTAGDVKVLKDEAGMINIKWIQVTGSIGTEGGLQQKMLCEYIRENMETEVWESKRCYPAAGPGSLQTTIPTLIRGAVQYATTDMIIDGKIDIAEIASATSRANVQNQIEAQRAIAANNNDTALTIAGDRNETILDIAQRNNETAIEISENQQPGSTWYISGGTALSQSGAEVDVDVDTSVGMSVEDDDPFVYE